MGKNIGIYVLTYNTTCLPFEYLQDSKYITLQVGSDISGVDICTLKDNVGVNISKKNPFYCELTGHYWLWKNISDVKYIGVEHYCRHLNISEDDIINTLDEYDIILPSPFFRDDISVQEFYKTWHIGANIDLTEEIVKDLYPEYAESWDKYIKNGYTLYYSNSFITKKENFNAICEFIFNILFEFEKRMGISSMEEWKEYVKINGPTHLPGYHKRDGEKSYNYQMRIGGFLFERLLTLYVLHNYKNIKHVELQDLRKEYIKKDMKTLLCCIGRQENSYIREFVEYYKYLGATNICLFDNNYDGEEDFRDVIGDYIDNGFVILKDYRNRKVCQLDAYNECYNNYGDKYDWILFFDIDEFMFINCEKNLHDYLARNEFDNYDMIHVNWLLYGDGGNIKNDGRGLLHRIPHPIDINSKTMYDFPDNFHVKSIIRGGLNNVIWNKFSHTPVNNISCCNSYGIQCDGNSDFTPYDFRNAGLRHFSTKTAEEYALKIKRGFPDGTTLTKENMVKLFFKRNEVTREKVEIFKEINGVDMSYLLPSVFEGEKRKDVQIYSLCYDKKDFQFLDDEVITPLQVGAANGKNVCELKDNTGDNISGGNYFYIENTGTYWIWKNVNDAKYKGQMQYRRPLSGVTSQMDFEEIFSKYDVITCEPFHHPSHKIPTKEEPMVISADTVEQGYAFSNCADDLYIMEIVIAMYYPDYIEDYYKYIKHGPNLYYSNGFIMKSEDYDKYSEFLFNCLNGYLHLANIHSENDLVNHVKYNIEVGKYQRYESINNVPPEAIKWQCAIGGFLSERLWTLWLLHNFNEEKIMKLPYIKMEEGMYT